MSIKSLTGNVARTLSQIVIHIVTKDARITQSTAFITARKDVDASKAQ